MLIFATSDKGGTGRSVTSANIAYRRALRGDDVCYLDFDFGSPTSAAVFDVPSAVRGVDQSGLHSYLRGDVAEPRRVDVWADSQNPSLRPRPPGAGQLVLLPGDRGGGEFVLRPDTVRNCVALFLRLEEEFDVILVDLSAGRSFAAQMVLEATRLPELSEVTARWLVFHRWTRQHIIAASGLVYGDRGIMATGVASGHDADLLGESVRFVRAAVPDRASPMFTSLRPAQGPGSRPVTRTWPGSPPSTGWDRPGRWVPFRSIRCCNGKSNSSPTTTCWRARWPTSTPRRRLRTWPPRSPTTEPGRFRYEGA